MENKKMHELVDASFDEQVRETQEVLRIRSVLDESKITDEHPLGPDLSRALEDFLARAKQLGFATKNVDNYAGYAEMGSGEMIGILAHLDVVPEGKESDWKHPPFAGVIEDGKLHGRGSNDDKGPAVAALYAMKALRDSGANLKKRFRLIVGLDEESGSRCMTHYNEVEEQPAFSFSPDASFPVVNAEKGILRATITKRAKIGGAYGKPELASLSGGDRFNVVPEEAKVTLKNPPESLKGACDGLEVAEGKDIATITAKGLSAHAMEPEKGENAVQKLLACLNNLALAPHDRELIASAYSLAGVGHSGEGLGIASSDEVSGPLTCNLAAVGLAVSNDAAYKEISLKLDIRYPVTADSDRLIGSMYEAIENAGAEVAMGTHKKPLYIPETHPAVQILLDAYEAVTGDRPAPISMGGGTYCRFMPNAVSAGPVFPGEPELAHQTDEYESLESLRKGTHIYAEALARFNEM